MNRVRWRAVAVVAMAVVPVVSCGGGGGDEADPATTDPTDVTQAPSDGDGDGDGTTTTSPDAPEVELPADLPADSIAFPDGFHVTRAPEGATTPTGATQWIVDLEGEGTPDEARAAAGAAVAPLGWTSEGEPVSGMAQDIGVELTAQSFTNAAPGAGSLFIGSGVSPDGVVVLRYVLTVAP